MNALRALEATLRLGSFGAAATELGVTTAAIGQRVRGLEEVLGHRLFARTSTGVRPNETALAAEQKLTAGFLALEDALSRLQRDRPPNSLALTMPSSFAENWFADRLSGFYQFSAQVDLRLDASNRTVDLFTENFDFAIRYCETVQEPYRGDDLFGDYVLPVCTPGFAERNRLSTGSRSLRGVPLVHLGERTQDPRWPDWRTWGGEFGFETRGLDEGMHLTEFISGMQIALRGQGLVLCGLVEAFDAIDRGRLVTPFGPGLNYPTGYQYRLVSVADRRYSDLQLGFADWMIAQSADFRRQMDAFLARGGAP